MDERVQKAVQEYRRDPAAVSKKTEEAIKSMGVRPDKKMVARIAAQVVAYRVESRKANKDSAAGILYDKRLSVWRCALWWGIRITNRSTEGAEAPAEAMSSAPCTGHEVPGHHKVVPRGGTSEGITQVGVEGRSNKAAEDDNEDCTD
jgi:hypothetical protein